MDCFKQALKGSPARDAFKQAHKKIDPTYYAFDLDLVLVSKSPPGIVAGFDYKTTTDRITFAEALGYNDLLCQFPIFIVESDDPDNGPFTIFEYLGGDWKPEPPVCQLRRVCTCDDWRAFRFFELGLRSEYYHTHTATGGI